MNKTNFNQTGGFPLKTERLQEMETAYSVFNSLGALAGNLTIISGCNLTGSTVSDGYVFIDGELLAFKSANANVNSTVIIIDEPVNRGFKNGVVKQVHAIRYATFGTADTSWLWTDFKRPFETKNIPSDLMAQLGAIGDKEDKTTVDLLVQRIAALEQRTTPQIKITTGTETINAFALGARENDYTKNYVYVTPPAGYTMANLEGFMPSIAQIDFGGEVDFNDTLFCKYRIETNRITVICNNSEARAASKINYMAIWIK